VGPPHAASRPAGQHREAHLILLNAPRHAGRNLARSPRLQDRLIYGESQQGEGRRDIQIAAPDVTVFRAPSATTCDLMPATLHIRSENETACVAANEP